jgi:hypothetical protein
MQGEEQRRVAVGIRCIEQWSTAQQSSIVTQKEAANHCQRAHLCGSSSGSSAASHAAAATCSAPCSLQSEASYNRFSFVKRM